MMFSGVWERDYGRIPFGKLHLIPYFSQERFLNFTGSSQIRCYYFELTHNVGLNDTLLRGEIDIHSKS